MINKIIITILLAIYSITANCQYYDLVFIGSSIGLQYIEVPIDKNLHYNICYWGVKSTYNFLDKTTNLSNFWKRTISFNIMLSVAFLKEFADKKFEWKDIYYTVAGIVLGVISFNLRF